MTAAVIAPAKVNLLLHVGPRRGDGLHEIVSLFASVDLADALALTPAEGPGDVIECPGVDGENLVARALAALRERIEVRPLHVRIEKRIPVAAGMGGGSADAAAVLRAANELAGSPLGPDELRGIAAGIGADVPSQVEPRHALVTGAGERVEPLGLPPMTLVVAPAPFGLTTAEVYAEADRIGATRDELSPETARELAREPLERLAPALENDLERAALSLRPDIGDTLAELRGRGALAALVTGSGPTAFGVFGSREDADAASAGLPRSLVAELR